MSEKICPKWVKTKQPMLGECKLRLGWLCVKNYAQEHYKKCSFLTSDLPKEEGER